MTRCPTSRATDYFANHARARQFPWTLYHQPLERDLARFLRQVAAEHAARRGAGRRLRPAARDRRRAARPARFTSSTSTSARSTPCSRAAIRGSAAARVVAARGADRRSARAGSPRSTPRRSSSTCSRGRRGWSGCAARSCRAAGCGCRRRTTASRGCRRSSRPCSSWSRGDRGSRAATSIRPGSRARSLARGLRAAGFEHVDVTRHADPARPDRVGARAAMTARDRSGAGRGAGASPQIVGIDDELIREIHYLNASSRGCDRGRALAGRTRDARRPARATSSTR